MIFKEMNKELKATKEINYCKIIFLKYYTGLRLIYLNKKL